METAKRLKKVNEAKKKLYREQNSAFVEIRVFIQLRAKFDRNNVEVLVNQPGGASQKTTVESIMFLISMQSTIQFTTPSTACGSHSKTSQTLLWWKSLRTSTGSFGVSWCQAFLWRLELEPSYSSSAGPERRLHRLSSLQNRSGRASSSLAQLFWKSESNLQQQVMKIKLCKFEKTVLHCLKAMTAIGLFRCSDKNLSPQRGRAG